MKGSIRLQKLKGRINSLFKDTSGFTFIEVIAALTLSGLIFVAVFSFISNTYILYSHSLKRMESDSIGRIIVNRMEELLGKAYLYPYYDSKSGISGEEYGFNIPISTSEGLLRAGLFLFKNSMTYRTDSFEGGKTLSNKVVLTNLVEPKFSYYDNRSGTWKTYWSADYYPSLVRFQTKVVKDKGEIVKIPPVIIPIMVGKRYDAP